MLAADNELTGHLFAHTQNGPEERYTARDRTLFALESDIRKHVTTAIALPALPPRHEARANSASVRHVPLPGLDA